MMFSREAMTANDTDAATPPRMPSTTNSRLRRGVIVMLSPLPCSVSPPSWLRPCPRPPPRARVVPSIALQHDSAAPTTGSNQESPPQTRSRATHNARSRPWTRRLRPSRFYCLRHPFGLPFPIENFALQTHAQHRAVEQHEPEGHR